MLELRPYQEEAVTAMYAEMAGYVESSSNIYTHSHP